MVLPNSPFKIWGRWVMGYLSYDRTNKQRDTQRNKQRLLLYISKYMYIIGTQSESSIYKFGLSVCFFVCFFVCLFVCLYPINVKTAEPIGPKFFVGTRVTPWKVFEWSNFQKFASIKIRFLKILKIHEFLFENPRNFFFVIC